MRKALFFPAIATFLVLAAAAWSEILAEDWTPAVTKAEPFNGRDTEWYEHGARPEWGCANPDQRDYFIVVHPKTGDAPGRPLYVVLHSAGHSGQTALECTRTVGNHDIYHAPDDFYALFVDCRANQGTDWWWGDKKQLAPGQLTPVEKRVMDTVAWTIARYRIDPNRVYLSGNSMGGSGTLGIGMRHGDVFAAIKANVPAGVTHVMDRLYFPPSEVPADVQLPDPPICVDYSGTNDRWSEGHDLFIGAMRQRHYALYAYWGCYGHANNHASIAKVNDLIDTFDWLSVRKNAAYPVFTGATADTPIPWPACTDTAPGQLNGFFRWENRSDTPQALELALFLVPQETWTSTIFPDVPEKSTADVTVRRVQKLRIAPNARVQWQFGDRSGTIQADATGTVTVPGLTITQQPTVLKLQP